MPDITLPSTTVSENEIAIPEPSALPTEPSMAEETPEGMIEAPPPLLAEVLPEDGIEEELIIEDFTIDGICGVY
jgi:mycofactocin precursor